MKFFGYARDNLFFILIEVAVIFFAATMMLALGLGSYAVFFIVLVVSMGNIAVFLFGYLRRKSYYNRVLAIFDELDKKYLISELIEPGGFSDSAIMYYLLSGANKSMNDRIAIYKTMSKEYREYIESWVHEIKTPIASARLALENNSSLAANGVVDDIDRMEALVKNVLYYARSSNVEKDYIIKRIELKELISSALKRNSRRLIENHISVDMNNLDCVVYTDEKWLGFILDQIITNSIKYIDGNKGRLCFNGRADENGVSLKIADSGIGIPIGDVARVFEKGFTGENGRKYASSTGMGLYLVKKLCDKLGINAQAQNAEKGAEIEIYFPKSKMHGFAMHNAK